MQKYKKNDDKRRQHTNATNVIILHDDYDHPETPLNIIIN